MTFFAERRQYVGNIRDTSATGNGVTTWHSGTNRFALPRDGATVVLPAAKRGYRKVTNISECIVTYK